MKKTLNEALATSYALFLKTQFFHWNVTGMHFAALHGLFGAQYEELFPAIDELAERLRAIGQPAPGSFAAFSKLSVVKDAEKIVDAAEMLKTLAADNLTLAALLATLVKSAEKEGDSVTADLATTRRQAHEKNAWMLKAHLG